VGSTTNSKKRLTKVDGHADAYWSRDGVEWQVINNIKEYIYIYIYPTQLILFKKFFSFIENKFSRKLISKKEADQLLWRFIPLKNGQKQLSTENQST
jgi:hypothetical protein